MPDYGGYVYRGLGYDQLAPPRGGPAPCGGCGSWPTSNAHREQCLGRGHPGRPDVAAANAADRTGRCPACGYRYGSNGHKAECG